MGVRTWAIGVLYSVMLLLGVSGNTLVIVCILVCRPLRNLSQSLIFNLCVSDLIYLLSLPFVISWTVTGRWASGETWCKVVFWSESTSKHVSMLAIMILSVDRYLLLCRNQWWKPRRTTAALLCAMVGSWTLVAMLMTPIYLFSHTVSFHNTTMCTIDWPSFLVRGRMNMARLFTLLCFTFMYCIPAITVLVCSGLCAVLLFTARKRANRLRKTRMAKDYQRACSVVFVLAMFYLACWTPFWVYNCLLALEYRPSRVAMKIMSVAHMLPYLNAAINPILYAFMSTQFRHAVRDTWNSIIYVNGMGGEDHEVLLNLLDSEPNARKVTGHLSNHTHAETTQHNVTVFSTTICSQAQRNS